MNNCKSIVFVTLLFAFAASTFGQSEPHRVTTVKGSHTRPGANPQAENLMYINTIPQADQFPGSDICAKLSAAIDYAYKNQIGQVDATHFSGVQPCSTDPFSALSTVPEGRYVNLVVNLGVVHVETSVPWQIKWTGLGVHGMSNMSTLIEYVGSGSVPGIIQVGSSSPASVFVEHTRLSDLFLYGDVSNARDALLLRGNHRSQYERISTWGVTECGIHSEFAVTDTFQNPHTSFSDASFIGIQNSRHSTPAHGLCFDQYGYAKQTTDGTVIDAVAEGLKGTGWYLHSANSMTFTSGTSENNVTSSAKVAGGVEIDSISQLNIFLAPDFEGNTYVDGTGSHPGLDVDDDGRVTSWTNVIASSTSAPFLIGPDAIWTALIHANFADLARGSAMPAYWLRFGGEIASVVDFASGLRIAEGPILSSSGTIYQNRGQLTTTANATDQMTAADVTPNSHCSFSAINAAAAKMVLRSPGVWVEAGRGVVILHHPTAAGGTFNLSCSMQ